MGRRAFAAGGDLGDPAVVDRMFAECRAAFGRLDLLRRQRAASGLTEDVPLAKLDERAVARHHVGEPRRVSFSPPARRSDSWARRAGSFWCRAPPASGAKRSTPTTPPPRARSSRSPSRSRRVRPRHHGQLRGARLGRYRHERSRPMRRRSPGADRGHHPAAADSARRGHRGPDSVPLQRPRAPHHRRNPECEWGQRPVWLTAGDGRRAPGDEIRADRPFGEVVDIAQRLIDAGFETWAVGGALRDARLGHSTEEVDLATAATPEQVLELFKRTVPVGIKHGTVGVLGKSGRLYEVTTFRRDVRTDGRHAVVEFGVSIDEDLARRDFTINALAYHPLRRESGATPSAAAPTSRPGSFAQSASRPIASARTISGSFAPSGSRRASGFASSPRLGRPQLLPRPVSRAFPPSGCATSGSRDFAPAARVAELIRLWHEVGAAKVWLPELEPAWTHAEPERARSGGAHRGGWCGIPPRCCCACARPTRKSAGPARSRGIPPRHRPKGPCGARRWLATVGAGGRRPDPRRDLSGERRAAWIEDVAGVRARGEPHRAQRPGRHRRRPHRGGPGTGTRAGRLLDRLLDARARRSPAQPRRTGCWTGAQVSLRSAAARAGRRARQPARRGRGGAARRQRASGSSRRRSPSAPDSCSLSCWWACCRSSTSRAGCGPASPFLAGYLAVHLAQHVVMPAFPFRRGNPRGRFRRRVERAGRSLDSLLLRRRGHRERVPEQRVARRDALPCGAAAQAARRGHDRERGAGRRAARPAGAARGAWPRASPRCWGCCSPMRSRRSPPTAWPSPRGRRCMLRHRTWSRSFRASAGWT